MSGHPCPARLTATPTHEGDACRPRPRRRGHLRAKPRSRDGCPSPLDSSILPVSKKVGAIAGNVVRGVEKLFELRVAHRIFINEEGLDLHGVLMEPAWKILPWILDVYAGASASFDL